MMDGDGRSGAGRRAGGGGGAGAGRGGGGGRGLGRGPRDGSGRGPRDGSGRGLGRGAGVAQAPPAAAPGPALPTVENASGLPAADVVPPAIVVRRPRPKVIVARPEQCTLCEACLDACRRGAIVLRESAEIDATICNGCGACISVCPNDVFATVGN